MDTRMAVLDVETTGLIPGRDRVVEVAVVQLGDDGKDDTYTTLINPGRDVGPTHVHGIAARDVVDAPRFAEVAGDVIARLAGALVVGHNVRFDVAFLGAEMEAAGASLPAISTVCTLALSRVVAGDLPRRKLAACCEHAGIAHHGAHSALGDAVATARLVRHYLARAGGNVALPPACAAAEWPSLPRSGRTKVRGAAPAAREPPLIARLTALLPATPAARPELDAYHELLERVLEDRVITREESADLFRLATVLGLSREEAEGAHLAYVRALAVAAAADGKVTRAERDDLNLVTELLGISATVLEALLVDALAGRAGGSLRQHDLTGQSVCFTGDSALTVAGERLTRAAAEDLARRAGLTVAKGVTRGLSLLVVADPATQSSKARRAREVGTRIVAELQFWRMLGIEVGERG